MQKQKFQKHTLHYFNMTIHLIEQGSPEWYDLRIGKITGSSSQRCIGSKWLEYADQLAGERLTGQSDLDDSGFESFDMLRGKELEPIARKLYADKVGQEIEVFGFIQPDDMPYFGMSPDGIYKNGTGAIEIKSPRIKKHIQYIRHDKIPTEHTAQIISIFICSETIEFVDFISYCPDCETWPMWIKRLYRKDAVELIEQYRTAIIKTNAAADKLVELVKLGETF